MSINGQHAVRKQWTGSISEHNDAIPKAIQPIQPVKITKERFTTAQTETIGVAALERIEIGSDKTAEKAATYVDPINQKMPIKIFKNSRSFIIDNILFWLSIILTWFNPFWKQRSIHKKSFDIFYSLMWSLRLIHIL